MRTLKTLEGISDGKFYDETDCVAIDAKGCDGCSACCYHVGDLVVLNPYDVYEIAQHLKKPFSLLIEEELELRLEQKIYLPYLRMNAENGRCHFLNEEERCSIHGQRPNICRLFPLGRAYDGDTFKYFIQVDSCTKKVLSPVKIEDWIGVTSYALNKKCIIEWHKVLKALAFRLKFVRDEEELANINTYLHQTFYNIRLEKNETFYDGFFRVLPEAKKVLGII